MYNRWGSCLRNGIEWLGPVGGSFGHRAFWGNSLLSPVVGVVTQSVMVTVSFWLIAKWIPRCQIGVRVTRAYEASGVCRSLWKLKAYQMRPDLFTLQPGISTLLLFLVLSPLKPTHCTWCLQEFVAFLRVGFVLNTKWSNGNLFLSQFFPGCNWCFSKCAEDGGVYVWGRNTQGQLGLGKRNLLPSSLPFRSKETRRKLVFKPKPWSHFNSGSLVFNLGLVLFRLCLLFSYILFRYEICLWLTLNFSIK